MALIETASGDFEAPVTTREPLMTAATIDFTVPVDNLHAQSGSLNEWKPITVHIADGSNQTIDIPAYITKLTGDGESVQVEARDTSIWLSRVGVDTPSDSSYPVNELLAASVGNSETRVPGAVLRTSASLWVGDAGIVTGTTADPAYRHGIISFDPAFGYIKRIPITTPAADSLVTFQWGAFNGSSTPITKVFIGMGSDFYAAEGQWGLPTVASPLWTFTANVSWDGGNTWGPDHVATVPQWDFEWVFDVTADHTWVSSDLTSSGNLQVRLTVSEGNPGGPSWERYVTWVTASVHYGLVFASTIPLLPGSIDPNAPAVQSAPYTHKYLKDWLTDYVQQTGYEWAIHPTNKLGWALFDWQPAVGGEFSATVLLNGQWVPIAGLEQGQLAFTPKTTIDGMAAVNRVVAWSFDAHTLTFSEAEADDKTSQALVGIQELIVKGNSQDNDSSLQLTATNTLNTHLQSQVTFTISVPKIPGLWAACRVGATSYFRGLRMPFTAWEGIVRIIERDVDEKASTMTLTLLPLSQTTPPTVASGFAVPPARTAQQAKWNPVQQLRQNLQQALQMFWSPRRG